MPILVLKKKCRYADIAGADINIGTHLLSSVDITEKWDRFEKKLSVQNNPGARGGVVYAPPGFYPLCDQR